MLPETRHHNRTSMREALHRLQLLFSYSAPALTRHAVGCGCTVDQGSKRRAENGASIPYALYFMIGRHAPPMQRAPANSAHIPAIPQPFTLSAATLAVVAARAARNSLWRQTGIGIAHPSSPSTSGLMNEQSTSTLHPTACLSISALTSRASAIRFPMQSDAGVDSSRSSPIRPFTLRGACPLIPLLPCSSEDEHPCNTVTSGIQKIAHASQCLTASRPPNSTVIINPPSVPRRPLTVIRAPRHSWRRMNFCRRKPIGI